MRTALSRIAATAVSLLALPGCFSVELSGTKNRLSFDERTELISAEVESFKPVARRTGSSSVEIVLEAIGSFSVETTRNETSRVSDRTMISCGLFPGVVNAPGSRLGAVFETLWLNVCFFGLPTVNGLVIEPLNPVASDESNFFGGRGLFARSALIGFHKYTSKATFNLYETSNSVKKGEKVRQVTEVTLELTAAEPFWESQVCRDGKVFLEGVPPGGHKGELKIVEIPHSKYAEDLMLLQKKPPRVTIPE